MRNRSLGTPCVLATLIAVLLLAPVTAAGQTERSWTAPRTVDGQPDLQGVWDFRTITTMQRPERFGDRQFLTEEEAAALEQEKLTADLAAPEDRKPSGGAFPTGGRTVGAGIDEQSVDSIWFDDGVRFGRAGVLPSRRTSLITDPSDGRIPRKPRPERQAQPTPRRRTIDGYENLGLTTRCLISLNAGPPMRPGPYNNNVQILQTPEYVAVVNEMIHDVRIIPLDGRPHLVPTLRKWIGDSRGHWEGETLVVETTNYNTRGRTGSANARLHVVERFTRVGPDTLDYDFTVTDPDAYTRPWSAQFPMTKSAGHIYEYACHEGNYALGNTLRGARAAERAAADVSEGSPR